MILNEVLSITAQELITALRQRGPLFILNEVLSITAQESCPVTWPVPLPLAPQ